MTRRRRFLEPALLQERRTQIAPRFRVARMEHERPAGRRNRFLVASLPREDEPQIVTRLGKIGFQFQGPAVRGDRLFKAPGRPARLAEIGVRRGVAGVELNGLANPFQGQIVAAALVREHAEVMPRARMVSIGGEDLAIPRLGIGQPPGLVVMQGFSEDLRDGKGWRCGHSAGRLVLRIGGRS